MKCNKIDNLKSCGKCIMNYDNELVYENISCQQLCKSLSSMLYQYSSENTDIKFSTIISCTGLITVISNSDSCLPSIRTLILVYCNMLSSWYEINKYKESSIIIGKLYNYMNTIRSTFNINKVRKLSIQLVHEIVDISMKLDNEFQVVPMSPKNGNELCFEDPSILSSMSSVGIVTLLRDITNKIDKILQNNEFMDMDKCTITEEGIIKLTNETIKCESKLLSIKQLYSKYLNTWCKGNFTKVYEINCMKKSIDKVNRSKDIQLIKDICRKLIYELSV